MLDRAICAAMKLGEPQVSLQALTDLERVLKDHGLRQVFSDERPPPQADLARMNVMPARHLTNASTGFISFRQYPQLRLVRPAPPALGTGHDLHASHETSLFWY
nr:hypothetical protein BDDEJBFL_00235 [Agrobacterium fabrum]